MIFINLLLQMVCFVMVVLHEVCVPMHHLVEDVLGVPWCTGHDPH